MNLVLISKLSDGHIWSIIDNPRWHQKSQEGLAKDLLLNAANTYAEYENCGCVYRVIRKEDLPKYVEGPL